MTTNTDLETLRRDYRAIAAPPYLATRVHASVADTRQHSRAWLPAVAVSLLVLGLIWVMPSSEPPSSTVASTSAPTSLSTLASLQPRKPGAAPSLARVHSVSVPRMPAKPAAEPVDQSTQNLQQLNREEIDHALT
jgi:hypothetical protein